MVYFPPFGECSFCGHLICVCRDVVCGAAFNLAISEIKGMVQMWGIYATNKVINNTMRCYKQSLIIETHRQQCQRNS
jgi:hypothetical protein